MTKRSRFSEAFVVTLVGVGLFAAIAHQFSFEAVVDEFRDSDWRYFGGALLVGWVITICRVVKYGIFFPFRGRLKLLYVASVYMRGLLYVLPFRLGEPASLYLLKHWGLIPSMTVAAPAWTLLRVGDALALLILMPSALAFILPNEMRATAWAAGLAGAMVIAVIILGTFWRHSLEMMSSYLTRYEAKWAAVIKALQVGLLQIKSRSRIAWSCAISMLIVALNIVVSVYSLWCLKIPISFLTGAAIAVIAQAASTLPFRPPLGIGLQDSVWAGLLVVTGLSSEQAFAGALSIRATQIAIIAAETLMATAIILPLSRPRAQAAMAATSSRRINADLPPDGSKETH